MKSLYYFLIVDVLLLIIAIKIVFKSFALFIQTISSQFSFWRDIIDIPPSEWEEKNTDVHYKLNIVYAVALALGILTVMGVMIFKI